MEAKILPPPSTLADRTPAAAAAIANPDLPLEVFERLRRDADRFVRRYYTGASVADREDATQEILMVLTTKYPLEQVNGGEGGMKALLRRISELTVRTFFRKGIRVRQHETVDDDVICGSPDLRRSSAEETLLKKQFIAGLLGSLNALETCVVQLRIFEELPTKDISARLSITEQYARVVFSRAIKKMSITYQRRERQ